MEEVAKHICRLIPKQEGLVNTYLFNTINL